MSAVPPRALGSRIAYSDVPPLVTSWVEERIGRADVVRAHLGGMSPGAAVTLETARGQKFFVKAVGAELNAQTAALFRAELDVLGCLPPVPYRPGLVDGYDDGVWVALLMEHSEGRHPDFAVPSDACSVEATVLAQATELTPAPAGVSVPPLTATVQRWQQRWREVQLDPSRYLPAWAVGASAELDVRIERLASVVPPTTLCHFDLRDDNLLIRDDGSAVVLDWGMARLGPKWVDVAFLAIQQATAEAGDALLVKHLSAPEQESATDFLLAFACSQAWNARNAADPSLPNMAAFCADDARRMLELARRRLEPK